MAKQSIEFIERSKNLDHVSLPTMGPIHFGWGSATYRSIGKRALDVALVVLAAPIWMLLVFGLALFVARDRHFPLYSQKRVGKDGRIFTMWKLRSMVPNADQRLAAYLAGNPDAKAEWDKTQKLRRDPRVTKLGKVLRKSSMDELPQLWNVLLGDMSLVGPRPMMLDQRSMYPGSAYYMLRPGITGNWQISDRNTASFAARAEFDRDYEESLCFRDDVKILTATFAVVVKGTGC